METRRAGILIVDDDEQILILLRTAISADNLNIYTALSGIEGLNIVRNENIDLILSDIRMPEMDGMLFSKEVRKIKPEIIIILMTAYGEVNNYLDALDLGVFDYLNKPFDLLLVKDCVKRALQQ